MSYSVSEVGELRKDEIQYVSFPDMFGALNSF